MIKQVCYRGERVGYKIGSFNMFKYQAYLSGDEIKKDLDKIADIIISETFDIVALQEIFSELAMKNLLSRLGSNWTGRWAKPNSRTAQAAEGYAFIWNTKRIKLAESQTASGKRIYYPRIYDKYTVDCGKNEKELVRNPYFARFNPINTFFEIRLINIHIMFSGNKDNNIIQLSDAEMRKNEFDILVKRIYGKETDKRYGNNMPAYTIILGDYNLNLKREWTKSPYVDEIIEITEGQDVKRVRTVQDQLTTLKQTTNNLGEQVRGYANNYDHFSYDENRFADVIVKSQKIDSVRKYCNDDFERHRKEVSDHVPISLNLELHS